jgi:3-hydroxyisobutyrate dehydrogenase-like beta-hydroxyacid dehydrogenase
MTVVGVIGLGAMGTPIALRMLESGHSVAVWNRTAARADPLKAAGAEVAASPAEVAAAADLVITMVTDAAALRAVTEGADGALAGFRHGSILVDMSTVGPRTARELGARVTMLDAPVLGSVAEARSGSLQIFAGGDEAVFERAAPVLAALGEPRLVGPLGSGAAAKLVANATLFGVLGVLGEAIALGDSLGLSRERVFEVLATTPLAAQAERRRPAIEDGDHPPRFALSLARKDADLVHEAAPELRLAAAARSWLTEAEAAGRGGQDYTAVLAQILRDT